MDKNAFLNEVTKRLSHLFSAYKAGYKIPPVDKHRLEGFMQAGVFLKLANNTELSELMETIHLYVFDQTIAERQADRSASWKDEQIDYSRYDLPTYERNKG